MEGIAGAKALGQVSVWRLGEERKLLCGVGIGEILGANMSSKVTGERRLSLISPPVDATVRAAAGPYQTLATFEKDHSGRQEETRLGPER